MKNEREVESLLSPILFLIQLAVALTYMLGAFALIVWGFTLSPFYAGLALAWFILRKLAGR